MNFRALVPLSLVAALPAQNPMHGNGVPSAYIANSPAVVDRALSLQLGSPTAPFGLGVLILSGGIGPSTFNAPGLPPIAHGLDLNSPFLATLLVFLDGAGDASLTLPLPAGVFRPTDPPLFADMTSIESGPTFSVSKTVRVEFAAADSWEATAPMTTARQMHTATALGAGPRDNRTEVLIAGGATGSIILPASVATAELFEPVTRTSRPLPPLLLPRSSHRALRLADGRVLITGGVTTGGAVTATCETFDPVTETFALAPAMSAPRAGHAMTLLGDGRVLVSGGVADWQNTATNLVAALNTAQRSVEVFDPATNAWSPLPDLAQRRFGHSQTVLQDGRVLVVSGINGGWTGTNGTAQVPTYTTTCEIFDPVAGTFAPTSPLVHTESILTLVNIYDGRAFHGATLLPSGDVLVTGGFVGPYRTTSLPTNEGSTACGFCDLWSPVTGTWTGAPSLLSGMAMHSCVDHGGGALVVGGFLGVLDNLASTPRAFLHDGTALTELAPIGPTGAERAAHTCTRLHDGTFLVLGGGQWPTTLADGAIYTPN